MVRARRPSAQARRRLQPDGRRDAQAAGVQGERSRRFRPGAGRPVGIAVRRRCSSAAGSNSGRCRSLAVRRCDRDVHHAHGMGTPQAPGAGVPAGGPPAGGRPAPGPPRTGRRAADQGGRRCRRRRTGRPGRPRRRSARADPARRARRDRRYGGRAGRHGRPGPAGTHAERPRAGTGRHPGAVRSGSQESDRRRAGQERSEFKAGELSKAKGGRRSGGGGGGVGDTHPAGALGPPVTPSTSHTPPTMPSGARAAARHPHPSGGSAMGGMPMGMPMGGLMPHGARAATAPPTRCPRTRRSSLPPQPHTEPVTGRVSDRTAAAAEASRTRADADDPDDEPPRGPVMRRITLAPLNDDRP